jgi:hypothetical protein
MLRWNSAYDMLQPGKTWANTLAPKPTVIGYEITVAELHHMTSIPITACASRGQQQIGKSDNRRGMTRSHLPSDIASVK